MAYNVRSLKQDINACAKGSGFDFVSGLIWIEIKDKIE